MKNYVDAMADALVDVLKYSDSSVEWPDIDDLQYDEAISPNGFIRPSRAKANRN